MVIRTPWKKSRTFGDIYGGRMRRRMDDNIFARAHSLQAPTDGDVLPLQVQDNPSRDFYFPLSMDEVFTVLDELPESHTRYLTHIWLRRPHEVDAQRYGHLFGTYITGSGVSVITLYAWPKTNELCFGSGKPSAGLANEIGKYGGKLRKKGKDWYGCWDRDGARQYMRFVLLHEVGHHIDPELWERNTKGKEDFADQYAYEKSVFGSRVLRGDPA